MLESLPFEGTIKVINKGVDIAILADTNNSALAFGASRHLVVCGISTAVLEITCFAPVDARTLAYYEKTTPCMLAMTEEILEAVRSLISPDVKLCLFEGNTQEELIRAVRDALK